SPGRASGTARGGWASACWRRPPAPPRRSRVTRAGRIGWWSAAVLALALGAVASPAVAADPAREVLAHADVYASPRALGAGTADARRRLELAAAELAAQGRPVKLAVVPGPA